MYIEYKEHKDQSEGGGGKLLGKVWVWDKLSG